MRVFFGVCVCVLGGGGGGGGICAISIHFYWPDNVI